MTTTLRPNGTDLSNWRTRPYSAWAFHNVRELIPTANIFSGNKDHTTKRDASPEQLVLKDDPTLNELCSGETDCIVILKDGKKQFEWSAETCDIANPHIVFSISKSITSLLAGCLWGQGLINLNKPISYYLSEAFNSAYEDCTVQQLLDMQVSLEFVENYTDPSGDYFKYRNATCWNPVNQTKPAPTLETFLFSLKKRASNHGDFFSYNSPNTDLLGLLIERITNTPFATLLSEQIWQPMSARKDGYVTVDRNMLARGAGGICITIEDLAKLGQLLLNRGVVNGTTIIPESWIGDTWSNGNKSAWQKGGFTNLFPNGNYRNKFYQINDDDNCLACLGIHGQWLFINPKTNVVIAKLSSQSEPLNETVDIQVLHFMLEVSQR